MIKNTFTKEERLCKKVLIDRLFHEGSSFMLYPFRVVYLKTPIQSEEVCENLPQILISVPKKRFKKAVTRNLIKRRIREVYRIHKQVSFYQPLCELENSAFNLYFAIQYIGKEVESYSFMSVRMQNLLKKFLVELEK